MSLAKGLIKTVDGLLKRFNATDRAVYKRIVTRTGGDALLGRPGTTTYADTLLSPQPAVQLVTEAYRLSVLLSGGVMAEIGDYVLIMSSTAMSRAVLQTQNMLIVFKGGGSPDEELLIQSVEPMAVNGLDVAFNVVVRSKKR